jgi:GT2 family glycosyltransferase
MSKQPFGYFVHHQGRGHAERCAAIVRALPDDRPVEIFCARGDIFPSLPSQAHITIIPSLFEPRGDEAAVGLIDTPDTLHCAPIGWPAIREAMATMTAWFSQANPALMICDVSAEIAQLARICSVPHVKILQHGTRTDVGHRAAYDGAAGLLAPCPEVLAQSDWSPQMRAKTFFAPGLGPNIDMPSKAEARQRLGIASDVEMYLVLSGGGGHGFPEAPLAVAARAMPQVRWTTIGNVARDWHATPPANLNHQGWVENSADYIAAADLVVASTGDTTCQEILTAGKPWLAIPEWRYFDEQQCKAKALHDAGLAWHKNEFPSHVSAWRETIAKVFASHRVDLQQSAVNETVAQDTAEWLEDLSDSLWTTEREEPLMIAQDTKASTTSVLTLVRGRRANLENLMKGLAQQTSLPSELVIAGMQPDLLADLPEMPFPVRQILVPGDELPLAAARNALAQAARGDRLIFLDVDCIPDETFVADYEANLTPDAGLLMGEVAYMPKGHPEHDWTFDRLREHAHQHSERGGPPETPTERCGDYRCFWSLNFGIHADAYEASGGFDERYVGYGGEDTDFGRTVHEANIPIQWMRGGMAYHQYHEHHMPPLHHIDSVVRNAEIFADKWGFRTMDHWLYCFGLMGLIEDSPEGLKIVRRPGEAELNMSRQQSHEPYASTEKILAVLESDEWQRRFSNAEPTSERFDRQRFLHRPSKASLVA